MSKKKSKRKINKFRLFLVIIAFLLLLSFAFIMLCGYVFKVNTKSIIIHNNNLVSDKEIIEAAKLEDYPNYVLTSSVKVVKNIKKIPLVYDVSVKKNLLLEYNIYIKEYKPLVFREDTSKIVLSKDKEIDKLEGYNLKIPSLVNYVPNTKYDKLISKLELIDYSLVQKISQIVYSPTKYDEDRFILYMNDSNRVYINLPKFKSFNKYNEMVTKFEGKTGKLYLDSGNYFKAD